MSAARDVSRLVRHRLFRPAAALVVSVLWLVSNLDFGIPHGPAQWTFETLQAVAAGLAVLDLTWSAPVMVALEVMVLLRQGTSMEPLGPLLILWTVAVGALGRRWTVWLAAALVAVHFGYATGVEIGMDPLDIAGLVCFPVAAAFGMRAVQQRRRSGTEHLALMEREVDELRSAERLRLADELHASLSDRLDAVSTRLAGRAAATGSDQRLALLERVDAEVRAALVEMRSVMHLLVDQDQERAEELAHHDLARSTEVLGDEHRGRRARLASLLALGVPGPTQTRRPGWSTLAVYVLALEVCSTWFQDRDLGHRVGILLSVAMLLVPRYALLPTLTFQVLSVTGWFGQLGLAAPVLIAQVLRLEPRRRAWWLAGASFALMLVTSFSQPRVTSSLLDVVSVSLVGVLLGLFLRRARQHEERVAARERELEVERERLLTEARSDLARELHDVVAHQLSVATLQVMGHRHSRDAAELDLVLDRVEAATRQAQLELAHLGRMVTSGEGVDQLLLPSMVLERVRGDLAASGRTVDVTRDGRVDELPVTIRRTVVRIVQESATNVLRYAPAAARVRIETVQQGDEVLVRVVNTGDGGPVPRSALSGGLGLQGLADRVDLSGGSFRAGRQPDGSWLVVATIPTD